MALSDVSKINSLFKKGQSVSSTNDTRQFFEEPYVGRPAVTLAQIWSESEDVPTTAPGGSDGQVTGVVKRYIDAPLAAVPGTTNSFFNVNLKNTIPFNFGDGSYNYAIKNSAAAAIAFGQGDWLFDCDTGVLTFYGTTPASMPPTISCYTYVGETAASGGIGGGGGGGSGLSWNVADGFTSPNLINEAVLAVFNWKYWRFTYESGVSQKIFARYTVPSSYKTGDRIYLTNGKLRVISPGVSKNTLLQVKSYLVKTGDATTPYVYSAHTSTNAETATLVDGIITDIGDVDLCDVSGQIDTRDIAPGDVIYLVLEQVSSTAPTLANVDLMVDETNNPFEVRVGEP